MGYDPEFLDFRGSPGRFGSRDPVQKMRADLSKILAKFQLKRMDFDPFRDRFSIFFSEIASGADPQFLTLEGRGYEPDFLDFRGSPGRFGSRGPRNRPGHGLEHVGNRFSAPQLPWRPFSCPVFDFGYDGVGNFGFLGVSWSYRPPGTPESMRK